MLIISTEDKGMNPTNPQRRSSSSGPFYKVIAISKETGNKKVVAQKVGAFRAAKLKAQMEAKGYDCEVVEVTGTDITMDQLYTFGDSV